jgi:hypothetical protein
VEFLISSNLEILDQGNEPTFCNGYRQVVIGITMGSFGLLESNTSWAVYSEPSLFDYRHFQLTLRGSVPVRLLIRKPRGANWGSFREGLRDRLERGPEMNTKDEAGLGLAVNCVQQALVSAYEDNCHLKPVKTNRRTLKWTSEQQSLRKGVRRLFNNR